MTMDVNKYHTWDPYLQNLQFSLMSLFCLSLPVGALTQAIRNFAKSLENWLTNAMINIPEEMVRIKVWNTQISFDFPLFSLWLW